MTASSTHHNPGHYDYNVPSEYRYPPPDHDYYHPEPRNGLGIAALCLGLVGLLFSIIPLTGFIAVALGVVGIILALTGDGRIRRGHATNRVMTWFGFSTSLLALIVGTVGMVMFFQAMDQFSDDVSCIDRAETVQEINACSGTPR